jgi:hypothetical protein
MPPRRSGLIIAAPALMLSLSAAALAQPSGKDADFARLHKDLCSTKEPWQDIPWRLSVLDAQAAAAKENKPVYMLVRSGHPLACV